MEKPKYKDLLNDPLWTAKRLKIFHRDGYKCTVCGSNKHIEVHHTFYYLNYPPPWEYPNKSLITLCFECHRKWHFENENVYKKPIKIKIAKSKKKNIRIRKPKTKKQKFKHFKNHNKRSKCIALLQDSRIPDNCKKVNGVIYKKRNQNQNQNSTN